MNFEFRTLRRLLRTAGLHENEANACASLFQKWLTSNGADWTNSRIKELRQWYLSYLSGSTVEIPQWFSHTKAGVPKGPLGAIFRLPTQGALLALSVNTLFIADGKKPTQAMLDKFHHGLNGNGKTQLREAERDVLLASFSNLKVCGHKPMKFKDSLTLPTAQCVDGTSVPIRDTKSMRVDSSDTLSKDKAYAESWLSVPDETVEFLIDKGKMDWIPYETIGSKYSIQLDNRPYGKTIGQIGFLGQPQLKLRTVANPNRITQHTLKPLGDLWYRTLDNLASDCYRDQEQGVLWCQLVLKQGVELSSVDMTSATDLLNLDACLAVVNEVYFKHLANDEAYQEYVTYFRNLSRGQWYSPAEGKIVSWKQGQPLGLYPSFALLGLTNNAIATLACKMAGVPLNGYQCLGDDMIIVSSAVPFYKSIVEFMGGEINLTKTMTSSKYAEFAGKVIDTQNAWNKAIKLGDFSDDSFMSYARQIGNGCEKYLRPRQRRVWNQLKYIPGIIVDGPYSRDGYGEPLSMRYLWYLCHVMHDKVDPDLPDVSTVDVSLLKTQLRLGFDQENGKLPWPIFEDAYQASEKVEYRKGDPRKWNQGGKSLLEVYESLLGSPGFVPFAAFKKQQCVSDAQ